MSKLSEILTKFGFETEEKQLALLENLLLPKENSQNQSK
jgi:hypothetical protein